MDGFTGFKTATTEELPDAVVGAAPYGGLVRPSKDGSPCPAARSAPTNRSLTGGHALDATKGVAW